MSEMNLMNRRERVAAALAALVVSLSVVSAMLLAFLADGTTEWFPADSALALVARRCDERAGSTRRHACLREIAAVRRAASSAPTRLAER